MECEFFLWVFFSNLDDWFYCCSLLDCMNLIWFFAFISSEFWWGCSTCYLSEITSFPGIECDCFLFLPKNFVLEFLSGDCSWKWSNPKVGLISGFQFFWLVKRELFLLWYDVKVWFGTLGEIFLVFWRELSFPHFLRRELLMEEVFYAFVRESMLPPAYLEIFFIAPSKSFFLAFFLISSLEFLRKLFSTT